MPEQRLPTYAELRKAFITASEFTAAMTRINRALAANAVEAGEAMRRFAALFRHHVHDQPTQVVTMSDGVTRRVPGRG